MIPSFVSVLPTAKQLVVVGHDTAERLSYVKPVGLGLFMTPQLFPFQCSTNVFVHTAV